MMHRLVLRALNPEGARRRALIVALLVGLPSLCAGLFIDDYGHLATLQGHHFIPAQWYNLFVFASDDPAWGRDFFERGPLPWFTEPGIRLRFFRPLSSISMALDWQLFGNQYWLYHVHSIAWYLALVAAVGWLLRRELSGPTAALALMIFALDEAHAIPAMWWSNRNALCTALPAVLGLCAHVRWREDGWKPGLPLSVLGYALGVCGGEAAIGIAGYIFAYEALAARGPLLRRGMALLPGAAFFVTYLILYKVFHFGVKHSFIYVDPAEDPVTFLMGAPGRFLALLSNMFLGMSPEVTVVRPWTMMIFAPLGALAAIGVFLFLRRHWSKVDVHDQRGMCWLALGAAVSMAPTLATFTSSRLLTIASLGAAALIAVLLRVWAEQLYASASRPARVGGGLFAGVHFLIPLVYWVCLPPAIALFGWQFDRIVDKFELDEDLVPQQHIITLSASDPAAGFYPQIFRVIEGKPRPLAWQMLSSAPGKHRITRVSENTIDLESLDFPMMTSMFEVLICHGPSSWPTGSKVAFTFMDVEVMEADAKGVYRVRFTFKKPLEDPSLVFLAWENSTLRSFTMPAIGQSAETSSHGGPLDFIMGG